MTPWRLLMTRQTHRLFQDKAQTRKYYGVFRSVSSYNCSCYYRNIAWYGHVYNFKRETDRWLAHRHPARNSLQLLDTCYPTQLCYTYMRLNLTANVSSSSPLPVIHRLHIIPSHNLLHELLRRSRRSRVLWQVLSTTDRTLGSQVRIPL